MESDYDIGQSGLSHGYPLVNGACYCASIIRGHAIYIEMFVSMPCLNYLKNHIGIQRCLADFGHVVTCGSCLEYHNRFLFKSILINVKVLQCGLKLEMVEAIQGLIKELDV